MGDASFECREDDGDWLPVVARQYPPGQCPFEGTAHRFWSAASIGLEIATVHLVDITLDLTAPERLCRWPQGQSQCNECNVTIEDPTRDADLSSLDGLTLTLRRREGDPLRSRYLGCSGTRGGIPLGLTIDGVSLFDEHR